MSGLRSAVSRAAQSLKRAGARANPVRGVILLIGLGLARLGVVDRARARRATDLSWPRVVTGIARMSKNAADVAMVGAASGLVANDAISGVGLAGPFWGLAFAFGGGFAAGTIALVSQRFGAEEFTQLGQAVRASFVVVVAVTIPVGAAFWFVPEWLIGLLNSNDQVVAYGATYLKILGLGVPFAGLNLVASRVLIGADNAQIPMLLRGGGAVLNIVLNGVFIFVFGMGVAGAAWGTVAANALVTGLFIAGLIAGRLPGIGQFPVSVSPRGTYFHWGDITDVVSIGTPVVGRNMTWTVARFPMLVFVGMFGTATLTAYTITRRLWGLMNVPGWGFGLAASSLVGQHLGEDDEETAAVYGREITLMAVATYTVSAAIVAVLAHPAVVAFGAEADAVPIAVGMVLAATIAIIPQGIKGTAAGALDATGDTNWPFIYQVLGMFAVSLPAAYLGATTLIGVWGIYIAFLGETLVPAVGNYYRFSTGKWKAISREYRPEAALDD
ncbi:MATE family efflux transporter [Halorhabdus sp. CBA1104]|uniref:MATE family efflux transporter n=1 Tax=Halorhabdus sp. CBA1104 TaxID=1380432 RepID=UPI0012B36860|nr:MATE family efflux transporter [Halorhabdus sp. CBA1104]QGN07910.1 MATE family efflux transporter [Halorhabdus sp. CBA1104]